MTARSCRFDPGPPHLSSNHVVGIRSVKLYEQLVTDIKLARNPSQAVVQSIMVKILNLFIHENWPEECDCWDCATVNGYIIRNIKPRVLGTTNPRSVG